MKWMIGGLAAAFTFSALGAPQRAAKPPDPKEQKERVLVLKDGAPETIRQWFDNLPVMRAEYVEGMEREARRLEDQIARTEHRPLPKVRAGGNAFGGDERRTDAGAANARYRDVKKYEGAARGEKTRHRARQGRQSIHPVASVQTQRWVVRHD